MSALVGSLLGHASHTAQAVLPAEQLITDNPQVGEFVVADGYEDDAVVAQQVARKPKAGVHHVQPVSVVSAGGFRVGRRPAPVRVGLPGQLEVVRYTITEVVAVYEVVARIVRRIDVDHLDLPVILVEQHLQNLQVVPFDQEILCGIPVDRLCRARPKLSHRRDLGDAASTALAVPREAIALALIIIRRLAQQLAQNIEIDPALGESVWECLFEYASAGIQRTHLLPTCPVIPMTFQRSA